jgi:hypothetical protein
VKDDPTFANIPVVIGKGSRSNEPDSNLCTVIDRLKPYSIILVANYEFYHEKYSNDTDRLLILLFHLWHEEFHLRNDRNELLFENEAQKELAQIFYPDPFYPEPLHPLRNKLSDLIVSLLRLQKDIRAQKNAENELKDLTHIRVESARTGLLTLLICWSSNYISTRENLYKSSMKELTELLWEAPGRKHHPEFSNKEDLRKYLEERLSVPGEEWGYNPKTAPRPKKGKSSGAKRGLAGAA